MAAFVRQLRVLKAWAGNPSLDRLRRISGLPRSTLSDALSPKRTTLPSLDLVLRYVRACGWPERRVGEWSSAWRRVQAASTTAHEAATAHDAAAVARAVPRQLPAAARHFVGRGYELKALDGLIASPPTGVAIAAITGMAGIGKTTLAVHWAHQVERRFPDGQLYIDLRGFDPAGEPIPAAEAIRHLFDALQVPVGQIPTSLAAQAGLYRSLLADRRMLLVLDNAVDVEQVRPLLPGTPSSLVLVTSRSRLTGLVAEHSALPLTLELPTTTEARRLLIRYLGPEPVETEPTAVATLIDRCARLPLALAIAAARAAESGLSLSVVAGELTGDRDRLDVLDTGDPVTNLRAVLSGSYRALGPERQRMLGLLALHPGPDISVPAAASLAGVAPARAGRLLGELARAHLVAEQQAGRYTFHDLVRAYAAERAPTDQPGADAERRAATHRMLDHYLHSAHAAALLLNPQRDPLPLAPPQAGVAPEALSDYEQALAWFTVERPVLQAAVELAAGVGFDAQAWPLAWTLTTFFERRGHWRDWARTTQVALRAAERIGDRAAQAQANSDLGRAYAQQGRYDDAHSYFQQALALFDALEDYPRRAHCLLNRAQVFEREARYDEALRHAELALTAYRSLDLRVPQGRALNSVGWFHACKGDHRQALEHCRQALALLGEQNDPPGEAATWDSLGYIHHRLGDHQRAVSCYENALDISRRLGNRYLEASFLSHLGDVHQAAGDPDEARRAWRSALSIFEELGHLDADPLRARLQTQTT